MARTLCSPPTAGDSPSKTGSLIPRLAGNGADRTTHVRTTDRPDMDSGILPGGTPASARRPARRLRQARANAGGRAGRGRARDRGGSRTRRTSSGTDAGGRARVPAETERLTGGTMIRSPSSRSAADRSSARRTASSTAAVAMTGRSSQISVARNSAPPQTFTTGDGLRAAAHRSRRANAAVQHRWHAATSGTNGRLPASFSVLTSDRRLLPIDGTAPALSRDGAEIAWISRDRIHRTPGRNA